MISTLRWATPNRATRNRQYAKNKSEKKRAAELRKIEKEERWNERHSLSRFETYQTLQRQRLLEERKAEEQMRLTELRETDMSKNNGMFGPASLDAAFSSRHDFTADRVCATPGIQGSVTLSSKPAQESFLSYSYRMGRERLSLHESAPGSRWPQRLSAQRNCGFAGGVRRGFRRDAVNEEAERDIERVMRRPGRRRQIAVPKGLQDAMAREINGGKEKDLEELVLTEEEDNEAYYRGGAEIGEGEMIGEYDWEDTEHSSGEDD